MASARIHSAISNPVSGKRERPIRQQLKMPLSVNISQCYDLTSGRNLKRSPTASLAIQRSNPSFSSPVLPLNEQYDKLKTLELLVVDLVELSSFASEEKKWEVALDRAREALEALNSLKVAHAQYKGTQAQSVTSKQAAEQVDLQPMTTGISVNELTLMVNSNLAAQLKFSGYLKDSIELYTQLCKMATSTSHQGGSSADSKYLLYRFGMNIGNVYFEMHDYQKALKYYRLTLDRLSSEGLRSLKIKLMNNIALTLMAKKQSKDAIVAWNILLNDNLIKHTSHSTTEQKAPSTGEGEGVTVCNSNHHKFGLNLMVCLHVEKDLASMLNTFKNLIGVGCCHQYERAIDFNHCDEFYHNKIYTTGTFSNFERQSNSSSSTASSSAATVASMNLNAKKFGSELHSEKRSILTSVNCNQTDENNKVLSGSTMLMTTAFNQSLPDSVIKQGLKNSPRPELATIHSQIFLDKPEDIGKGRDRAASGADDAIVGKFGDAHQISHNNSDIKSNVTKSAKLPTASDPNHFRQLMDTLQGDKLEMLIKEKENQISRSILMSCSLMLNLDNNSARSETKSSDFKHNTSAINVCLKLLTESETYQALVCDLKANSVSSMLERRHKLVEAIDVLKGMEQQVEREHNLTKPIEKRNTSKGRSSFTMPKSGMVATNFCLLYSLQGKIKDAIEFGLIALKFNSLNVKALINTANCYYQLSDLNQAKKLYQQALSLNPSCMEANYNIAIIHRKLNRPYEELNLSTKLILTKFREHFSSLIWRKMILSLIQLALLHQSSKSFTQSKSIIDDLIKNSKQSPEVYLLASIPAYLKQSEILDKTKVLQQIFKEHPYHLALAERLIALYIQNFNYDSAKLVLTECIRARPDQVKWYQMLAECHRRAAEYIKATSVYKSAIETFPEDTSCLKALIKLLDELGLEDEKKSFDLKLGRISEMRKNYKQS